MAKQIPDLKRYPARLRETLQAWDSADELILKHLETLKLAGMRLAILNDQFGALSSTLAKHEITSYTDSYVSDQGIRMNSDGEVRPIHSLGELSGTYDLVLIKLPKNLSFFEDTLARLSYHLGQNAQVIVGAMIKHLPRSAFDLLQKYIGNTHTSLAEKKARLIFASFEKSPVTTPYPIEVDIEGFAKPFLHDSNLFSREKLDIGTRFFLEHIPTGPFQTILDLGCANGIVGIRAQQKNPTSKIIFSDDSAMALHSAQENYKRFYPGDSNAEFIWTNCYENQTEGSLDLVLCNPPFHQNNTLGDFIARQMFEDTATALKVGGLIRVIGNSHLGYGELLKRRFGNVRTVATNAKFVILDAIKSPKK